MLNRRRSPGSTKLLLAAVCTAAVFSLVSGCGDGDRDELVLGLIRPSLDYLPLQLASLDDDPDLAGIKVHYFSSGWEAGEALVAGRLDAAILPFTYAWTAASRGLPIRSVGFLERESDGIVARQDIRSLDDLAGRRIGVLRASTLEVLAVLSLRQRGIEAELVALRGPSEMVAALRSGDVDAVSLYVPPILTVGDEFHVVHWFGDDFPGHPCCDLVVHEQRVRGKTEVLMRLRGALARAAVRLHADHDRAVSLAAARYSLPPHLAEAALARTRFELGREESGRLFQQRAAEVMRELGHLDRVPDTSDVYLPLRRR